MKIVAYRAYSLWLALIMFVAFAPYAFAQDDDGGVVPDDNVGKWAVLVGTFLPLGIAAINRRYWSPTAKGISTFILCTLAAGVTAFLAGEFDSTDVITALIGVLFTATVSYKVFWGPEASRIATKVEDATG